MTTYKSYEEAKISNPESEIWASKLARCGRDNVFGTKVSLAELTNNYFKCNPADHCMTVEQFLKAGHKFVEGDICINMHYGVEEVLIASIWNEPSKADNEHFILRASALENKMNIDKLETQSEEQPKRVRYDYERVDFVEHWEYFKLMSEEGDLYIHCAGLIYEGFGGDNINLANELHSGSCIYRRIETSMEWWEDAAEFVKPLGHSEIVNGQLLVEAAMTRNQWCDFARILLEQGE